MLNKIVLASGNPGKLKEFASLFDRVGIELISQRSLGIPDAAEPHVTFIENAIAKARHASSLSGLPALADDSGICVEALDGAPGVHSARYAQPVSAKESVDSANNAKLINALRNLSNRRACYVAVLVLLRSANDPQPLVAEASWHGIVIDQPRGLNGFGYDPYFLLPNLGLTAAELDPKQKNNLSHRGQACEALFKKMADADLINTRAKK